ncbi:EPIDERMAL PATTERNING FACTOR-like protein 1 [Striga hermonthica]|uniref:Epidermal patterning factor-like protein n=1 Tax=Striga hermonthica TaxID=68872 RepID=A0A9N7RKW4_STRHE|nr:EPIDERMAL PATTERNING FACTOR-like protein 1 [Striga hermonthica]
MTKTFLVSLISSKYLISLIIALLLLLSPSYCSNHYTFRDLTASEEKARLGSTPPSCHNKCNQCHPCAAVQVPAQPSRSRVDPGSAQEKYPDPSTGNRYSNYKPLGWKCTCNGHDYNP